MSGKSVITCDVKELNLLIPSAIPTKYDRKTSQCMNQRNI